MLTLEEPGRTFCAVKSTSEQDGAITEVDAEALSSWSAVELRENDNIEEAVAASARMLKGLSETSFETKVSAGLNIYAGIAFRLTGQIPVCLKLLMTVSALFFTESKAGTNT